MKLSKWSMFYLVKDLWADFGYDCYDDGDYKKIVDYDCCYKLKKMTFLNVVVADADFDALEFG